MATDSHTQLLHRNTVQTLGQVSQSADQVSGWPSERDLYVFDHSNETRLRADAFRSVDDSVVPGTSGTHERTLQGQYVDSKQHEKQHQLHNFTQQPSLHNGHPTSIQHQHPATQFSRVESPLSPDTSNDTSEDSRLHIVSPSSRSRTSSNDTTATSDDTASTHRYTTSSGIPSSIWSGRESLLEYVVEEEGLTEDIKPDSTFVREGESSFPPQFDNCEKTLCPPNEPETSIVGPLPNFGNSNSIEESFYENNGLHSSGDSGMPYFNPDDSTVVPVARRKGISRSSSMEGDIISHSSREYVTEPLKRKNETKKRKSLSRGRKRIHSIVKDGSGRNEFLMDGKNTFQIQDDLTKDNHHFMLSEALTCVIEEYKSHLHEQAYDEYLARHSIDSNSSETLCSPTRIDDINMPDFSDDDMLDGRDWRRDRTISPTSLKSPPATPIRNFTPMSLRDISPVTTCDQLRNKPMSLRESTISLHRKWLEENYRANISKGSPMGETVSILNLMKSTAPSGTAEDTANGLLQHVAGVLGGNAQVEFRVPQVMQLPSDFVTSLKKVELLNYSMSDMSPIRGGTDWAPPRQQVIHTVYSSPSDIKEVLTSQGNKCPGCSMYMKSSRPKALMFCNYTGKLFCASCHHGALSYIPGHIINSWSFRRYPVSDFARDTLTNIEKIPLFNLESLNLSLYFKISELNKVKDLRTLMISLRNFFLACSRAEKLRSDYDEYYSSINGDVHLYSLNDFVRVKSGDLAKELKELIGEGEKHVKSCLVCQGQGYFCELCHDTQVIFPFQIFTTTLCPECGWCFHKACYKNLCPRCERKRERQQQ